MMLSKNSSVSRRNACAQVVVEVREHVRVRLHAAQVAQLQPLAGEVLDERLGRESASIRRTCCSSTAGSFSLPLPASVEQLVVRNAAPEEERQTRGELEIADAVARRRARRSRIALDAEQELRAGEQTLERQLDAGLERCRRRGQLRRTEQRAEIVAVVDGPPIGAPRERVEDRLGARRFGRSAPPTAGTRKSAAGSACRPAPVALNGPADRQRSGCAAARSSRACRRSSRRNGRQSTVSSDGDALDERRRRPSRGPAFTGTRALSRASIASPASVGCSHAAASRLAADRRHVDRSTIDRISTWCGYSRPRTITEVAAIQLDLEIVLAVERKHVADHQPARACRAAARR